MAGPGGPTIEQVVPKAVFREKLPVAVIVGSAEDMALKLNEAVDEGRWRQGLESASQPQVSEGKIGQRVQEIGFTRGANGEKTRPVGSGEDTRYLEGSEAARLDLEFIAKGYEGLTNPNDQLTIKIAVEKAIMNSPVLANEYALAVAAGGATVTQKDAFIERIIKDPRYSSEVRKALKTFSEQPAIVDTVSEKGDVISEKTAEQAARKSEVTEVGRRMATNKNQLAAYDRTIDSTTGKAKGADAREIIDIETNITTIRGEIVAQNKIFNNESYRLQQLEQERAASLLPGYTGRSTSDIDTETTIVRGKIDTAKDERDTRQVRIDSLPRLKEREIELKTEQQELKVAEGAAKVELAKANAALIKAQREYQDALSVRVAQEQAMVDQLSNIFTEAANAVLGEDISTRIAKFDAVAAKAKEKKDADEESARAKAEKAFWLQQEKRYTVLDPKGNRIPNIPKINGDFGGLMTYGQEAYIGHVLSETINPDPTIAPPRRYNATEISELMANKEFMDNVKNQATTLLLARKDMLKGGISKQDVYTIATSTWGRQLLEDAYNNNDSARELMDRNGGRDALNNPNFLSRVQKEWGGKSLFWLLLLGIPLGMAAYSAIDATK